MNEYIDFITQFHPQFQRTFFIPNTLQESGFFVGRTSKFDQALAAREAGSCQRQGRCSEIKFEDADLEKTDS